MIPIVIQPEVIKELADCIVDVIQNKIDWNSIDWQTVAENQRKKDWIPVSERLPNRNGVYNVTRKIKEGETIYFISDASYFDGQNTWHRDTGINHGRPYLTDVIAWMPKPEPYKKEGEEE